MWLLEKMRQGRTYRIRLRVSGGEGPLDPQRSRPTADEELALGELARWRRDPIGFAAEHAGSPTAGAGVMLDRARIQGYVDALKAAGVTDDHRKAQALYLGQWANRLAGADLRTLDRSTLAEHLDAWGTARKPRAVAIQGICTWLVEARELATSPAAGLRWQEVTARDDVSEDERGYTAQVVEAIYAALPAQAVRDVVRCRVITGMHGTEIERVAAGKGRVDRVDGRGTSIAGVVVFRQKKSKRKEPHRVSVDAATLAAFERLIARGRAPRGRGAVDRALRRASKRLGIDPPVNAGQLRHTFVTLARERGQIVRLQSAGVPLEMIREVLAHAPGSKMTTEHYDATKVPPMIRVPLDLRHPDDPPLQANVARGDRDESGRGALHTPPSRRRRAAHLTSGDKRGGSVDARRVDPGAASDARRAGEDPHLE